MRQLVELHDHLDLFETYDAQIVAIAQNEPDATTLARIPGLVGDGIAIVGDETKASTDAFDMFSMYIVDAEGVVRVRIPGTKQARPRLDLVFSELERLSGIEAPELAYQDGRMVRGEERSADGPEVGLRWAWSHDKLRPYDSGKLIALPTLSAGLRVAAGRQGPSLDVTLPDGVSLLSDDFEPLGATEAGDLAWFEGDIPFPVVQVEAGGNIEPGQRMVSLRLRYRPLVDGEVGEVVTQVFEVPVTLAARGGDRGQLYGWERW